MRDRPGVMNDWTSQLRVITRPTGEFRRVWRDSRLPARGGMNGGNAVTGSNGGSVSKVRGTVCIREILRAVATSSGNP